MSTRGLTATVLCLSLLAPLAAQPKDSADAGLKAIRPEAIRAHVRFLADDLLEGRATGTRGYDLAARYVATQFELLGLEPAGTEGYLQPIKFRRTEIVKEEAALSFTRDGKTQPLAWGTEFVLSGSPNAIQEEITAPVVYAGYGISAPELGHDDYAGLEVKGKIVAIAFGGPSRFPTTQRAHHSSTRGKLENAARHGAVGVITFFDPAGEKRFPWKTTAMYGGSPGLKWLEKDGSPHDGFPQLKATGSISRGAAEALFARAPKPLEQVFAELEKGKPQGFDTGTTATMKRTTKQSEIVSPNIVAALRGSDPKLRGQYVVYTAHADHLGLCKPVGDDNICNGAVDNASGTAAVLEVARAFRALPQRPRRSILFVVVTGEEKGLLGSDYFAHYPTVPPQDLVANVNMDGASILYPLYDVVPLGAQHSSLGPVVEQAGQELGVRLAEDPMPEQTFFVRSDQYSFVRQGIPAVALNDGMGSSDPGIHPREITDAWIKNIYHTAKDDMNQPLDFGASAKFAQFNFLVGYKVAQADQRPQWNKGDFFGETFGKKK